MACCNARQLLINKTIIVYLLYNPKSNGMKTLKITLLLLAILLLTVSGQSSDTLKNDQANTYKQADTHYYLLAHDSGKIQLPPNQ